MQNTRRTQVCLVRDPKIRNKRELIKIQYLSKFRSVEATVTLGVLFRTKNRVTLLRNYSILKITDYLQELLMFQHPILQRWRQWEIDLKSR